MDTLLQLGEILKIGDDPQAASEMIGMIKVIGTAAETICLSHMMTIKMLFNIVPRNCIFLHVKCDFLEYVSSYVKSDKDDSTQQNVMLLCIYTFP